MWCLKNKEGHSSRVWPELGVCKLDRQVAPGWIMLSTWTIITSEQRLVQSGRYLTQWYSEQDCSAPLVLRLCVLGLSHHRWSCPLTCVPSGILKAWPCPRSPPHQDWDMYRVTTSLLSLSQTVHTFQSEVGKFVQIRDHWVCGYTRRGWGSWQ
jgi:hypothetical protein